MLYTIAVILLGLVAAGFGERLRNRILHPRLAGHRARDVPGRGGERSPRRLRVLSDDSGRRAIVRDDPDVNESHLVAISRRHAVAYA